MPARSRQRPVDRVYADRKTRIEAGEWVSGEQLPTVSQLAVEYDTSRSTVGRAVERLAEAGALEIVARWGIFRAGT